MRLPCRRCQGESGAFIVMWALLLVAILTMVAIVVDLGALRVDRRTDRAAADAAATAAANDLPLGSAGACSTAVDYASQNLGVALTPDGTTCASWGTTCNPTGGSRSVRYLGSGYVVTITNPVAAGDPLLDADAVGGHIPQAPSAAADGEACERVGVRVEYTRSSIFGRVVGNTQGRTDVHSVARFVSIESPGTERPALVALHPTHECTIDAQNGIIHAIATGTQPALIYADSDASGDSCPAESTVFAGRRDGQIWADPSPAGPPGEMGYFATEARAFDIQPNYDQNDAAPPIAAARVKLPKPITRRPLDAVYNCGSVVPVSPPVPGCTTGAGGTDLISDISARYGDLVGAPAGFTVFPGAAVAGTCAIPPVLFPGGQDWYINCPNFEVATSVAFQERDVVFAGNVEIKGGGRLIVNQLNATDSAMVIKGTTGLTTASGGWSLEWRRTFVFMDNPTCSRATPATCGGIAIQVGDPSLWTPPTSGTAKDLIFWSEADKVYDIRGNPSFLWEGVFASPNATFQATGTSAVDATEVQLWVAKARTIGTSQLLLRADPDKSVATSRTGSALVR